MRVIVMLEPEDNSPFVTVKVVRSIKAISPDIKTYLARHHGKTSIGWELSAITALEAAKSGDLEPDCSGG